MRRSLRGVLLLGVLAGGPAAAGCAQDAEPMTVPGMASAHLLAMSSYEASLSTMIELYGTGFPDTALGQTLLVLTGEFHADDGAIEAVDATFPVRVTDQGTARWTSFGPYRVPFGTRGNQTGVFRGTAGARIVTVDGTVIDDATPIDVTFRVKPSIVMAEFQPTSATCAGPIERALGGVPYRVRVQAIGFEPRSFTYTLGVPNLEMSPIAVRHLASGAFDSMGETGDFTLPAVPDDRQSYTAILTVEAQDQSGRAYRNSFSLGVHRPIEVFYNGNVEVAEIYTPEPISGCMPGGINGRNVTYIDTQIDTRMRGYAVNWNESWLRSHTSTSGTSTTEGANVTNGVGFTTTDANAWRWQVGAEGGGEFGISQAVKIGIKVSGHYGEENTHTDASNANRNEGLTRETTSTDTESATESNGRDEGENFSWQVSSSDLISRGFAGHVIAGTFGVFYRQPIRLLRRAAVVTYNQCGAGAVVADVDFIDWSWSPDLALGGQCPPLPASNLPAAQCFVSPCLGE